MKRLTIIITALACVFAVGCASVGNPVADCSVIETDATISNQGEACASLYDCAQLDIPCVIVVCDIEDNGVDGICRAANVAMSDEPLPIDLDSGLPLGKHCKQ